MFHFSDITTNHVIAFGSVASILTPFLTVFFTNFKNNISSKSKDLESLKEILNRRNKIRNSNKYIKDLEIREVSYFKGFKWGEVEIILNQNIGIVTLSNLRYLKKHKILILKNNKIILPNKCYISSKYILSLKSFLIVIGFITYILLYISMVHKLQFSSWEYLSLTIGMFILLFFFEVIAIIYHFDGLITYNLIIQDNDPSNNTIIISEDFSKE